MLQRIMNTLSGVSVRDRATDINRSAMRLPVARSAFQPGGEYCDDMRAPPDPAALAVSVGSRGLAVLGRWMTLVVQLVKRTPRQMSDRSRAGIMPACGSRGCRTRCAVVVGATAFAVLGSWSGAAATTATVVTQRALVTTVESPADLPGYEVVRPRNLDATGNRLPVIVWANGGCVRHNRTWLPLLQAWAQAGYVVVAIASPPEGSTSSPRTTAADQAAAIDWAVKQNKLAGGRYARRLDLRRIVAAGNSCGGITTIALAATDPRVDAVFVLSGSGSLPGTPVEQARQAMSGVTVPIAYVSGGPEDISRGAVETDLAVLPANTAAYAAFRRRAITRRCRPPMTSSSTKSRSSVSTGTSYALLRQRDRPPGSHHKSVPSLRTRCLDRTAPEPHATRPLAQGAEEGA